MKRQKIDIHNTEEKYAKAKQQLLQSKNISQKNKEYILNFLKDAELGKTILKKQKKKIGKRTCLKYLYQLKTCAEFLKKDFDTVTIKDMEAFIYALEDDTITKKNKKTYSGQTKKDFKITLKKFYKWLLGNNEEYPKLVRWLDTFHAPESHLALDEKEIQKIIEIAQTSLDKAFISVLFDLGARIEEFLNIQLDDILKTNNTYKIHIEFSKTFSRTLPLDASIPYLKQWLQVHPETKKQLFPLSYWHCLRKLHSLGKQALGMPITPQVIRHSKATQLAQAGVGRYQMCEWMGWAMSSKMPDRYIRGEGIDNEKTLEEIKRKRQ